MQILTHITIYYIIISDHYLSFTIKQANKQKNKIKNKCQQTQYKIIKILN